jgi:hypothetical protein
MHLKMHITGGLVPANVRLFDLPTRIYTRPSEVWFSSLFYCGTWSYIVEESLIRNFLQIR